jgi:hypothetical protein
MTIRKWGIWLGVAAVLAAIPLLWVLNNFMRQHSAQRHGAAPASLQPLTTAQQAVVTAYIEAVQEADCETVAAMTQWIRERLDYVGTTTGEPSAVEHAKDKLCDELQERPVEGNLVGPEGIEDKYVFPPGAEVTVVGRDTGRRDLQSPVAYRAWMRVGYPVDRYAPRDEAGRPIRAMTVGLTIAPDGAVVKAGILGNVEVAYDSYEFGRQQGEANDGSE